MKKLLARGRKAIVVILTFMLVLSMTTSVFAGWATYNGTSYNSGNVYLEEVWLGAQQIIDFYQNGSMVRTVASEGKKLWIDNKLILENLYGTGYWCYDQWGNIYAIDTAMNLLLCRVGTTQFVVNTSVRGCTGFQRDSGLIGYLVYTNNSSYSLEDLLRNNNYNTNFNNNYYVPNAPTIDSWNGITPPTITTSYPYVYSDGSSFYHYENSGRYQKYYWDGSTLYYRGINNSNSSVAIATKVTAVTFDYDNYQYYIAYKDSSGRVYRYPIGKTSKSYRQQIGKNASSFVESNYVSTGYYNTSGQYKDFYVINNNNSDDDEYPRVKKSGNYWYFYVNEDKYYTYYLYLKTLYYAGKNSSSGRTKLATGVEEITFSDYDDGYIIYADDEDEVYYYPVGKTGSSNRGELGDEFDEFDEHDYKNYMSNGYIDDDDDFIDFDF